MKRYIYIIIGIIVAAAVAIGILLLIKSNSGANQAVNGGGGTGALPPAGTTQSGSPGAGGTNGTGVPITLGGSGTTAGSGNGAGITRTFGLIANNPVADYFVNAENEVYGIQSDGQAFTVTNGQASIVNSSTINDIISVRFSFNGKKVLVNYGDPSVPSTTIYDFAANTWTILPKAMQSPVWSPISYQIAYITPSNSGRLSVDIMDATSQTSIKKAPSAIFSLAANDLSLQWPLKNDIILSDRPSAQESGSIWLLNTAASTFSSLAYEVRGAESSWSGISTDPYGLIFYNGPSGQSVLSLRELSGATPIEKLSFLTLPSKCTFDMANSSPAAPATDGSQASSTGSSTPAAPPALAQKAATSTAYFALYCGVPRSSSGFASAQLPDDYNMMSLFTSDDLYRVNASSGDVTALWNDQSQNMDVSDIKFFNGMLFFVNRYDQKLYGLTEANQ